VPRPRALDTAEQAKRTLVDQISAGAYTIDQLRGLEIPGIMPEAPRASRGEYVEGTAEDPKTDPQIDFYYELVEDRRGDPEVDYDRYRLLGGPDRKEGSLYFSVNIERASEDDDRQGLPQAEKDDVAYV